MIIDFFKINHSKPAADNCKQKTTVHRTPARINLAVDENFVRREWMDSNWNFSIRTTRSISSYVFGFV
uniref:Uncharacterized protein n=1 Tax=Globodera rostochiensis TaxID=31243 RepID=A0A914H0B0_GLORO